MARKFQKIKLEDLKAGKKFHELGLTYEPPVFHCPGCDLNHPKEGFYENQTRPPHYIDTYCKTCRTRHQKTTRRNKAFTEAEAFWLQLFNEPFFQKVLKPIYTQNYSELYCTFLNMFPSSSRIYAALAFNKLTQKVSYEQQLRRSSLTNDFYLNTQAERKKAFQQFNLTRLSVELNDAFLIDYDKYTFFHGLKNIAYVTPFVRCNRCGQFKLTFDSFYQRRGYRWEKATAHQYIYPPSDPEQRTDWDLAKENFHNLIRDKYKGNLRIKLNPAEFVRSNYNDTRWKQTCNKCLDPDGYSLTHEPADWSFLKNNDENFPND